MAKLIENRNVAMVNEMVYLAAILRRIGKQLYHDSKGLSLLQKSGVATEIDDALAAWKARLPPYLDFTKTSLRGEEWAAKQKLVLHLRYLNARILVHRPFLVAWAGSTDHQPQVSQHVELCLCAARETVEVMYNAFVSKHYFRTWWYNSTYTLYAGMIVLYVIMLRQEITVPVEDLLNDVSRAREILLSMEESTVAIRSAGLIQECLQLVRNRQDPSIDQQSRNDYAVNQDVMLNQADNLIDPSLQAHANSDLDNLTTNFFTSATSGQQQPFLASLIDPYALQDITIGEQSMPGIDFSSFVWENSEIYGGSGAMDMDFAAMMQG